MADPNRTYAVNFLSLTTRKGNHAVIEAPSAWHAADQFAGDVHGPIERPVSHMQPDTLYFRDR
jgi:hypothetical protein